MSDEELAVVNANLLPGQFRAIAMFTSADQNIFAYI